MRKSQRSNLASGLALILIGALFLVVQFVPGLHIWLSWPLIIVGVGVLLLVIGLLTGVPGMAVPACVIGGIGGLLYWQNTTGNWESWAYAWALIPGFAGVGGILSGLLGGEPRRSLGAGAWLILISLILYAVFGSFFGAIGVLGTYWPVLIIALGVLSLIRPLLHRPE